FHYLLTTRLLGPLSSAWIWGSVAFIFGWALREKERPLSFLPLFLALPWIGLGAWIGSRWASVGLFLIGAALFLAASWRGAFRASLNQSTASLHFGVAIASMGALLALSSSIGPAFVQSAFFGAPSASSSETLAFLTSRLRDEGTIPKILMWTSPILGIASSALLLGPAFKASPPSSRFVGGLIFIATGFLITAFGSAGNLMGQAYALKYLSAYAIGTIELPTLPIPNESSELDLLVRENQVHLPKSVSASIGKDEQALKTKLESLIGQREEEPGLPLWLHNSSPEQVQRENAGTTQVGIKKLERLTVAIDRRTQASFLRDFIRASRQAGFTVLCIGASPEAPSSAGREVLMEWAPPLAWFAPPFGCIEAYLPEAFESVSHDHWHGTIGKEATLLLRKESSQAQQQIDAMQVETLFGPESIKIDQDVSNVNALTEIAQLKIGAEASLQSMLQLISKLRGIGIRPVLTGE
ncbi:MAG: hypothetical protein NZM37_12760, partial [Sandaracinaceae bacterium]|nr:hypothetical protein [Sandaracinaceae bacterium]